MSHAVRSAHFTRQRLLTVVAGIAALAVMSACGGSSSGGKASAGATFATALKLQQAGHLADAKQLYQQLIQTNPKNYLAQYNIGVIDQSSGDVNGALAAYGAALTAKPTYVPALYNEATIYGVTDPALAITTYRDVIKRQPIAATAYLNLGLLEVKHGSPKTGIHDLATAVEQDSSLLAQIPKHLRTLVESQLASSTTSPSPTATATSSG